MKSAFRRAVSPSNGMRAARGSLYRKLPMLPLVVVCLCATCLATLGCSSVDASLASNGAGGPTEKSAVSAMHGGAGAASADAAAAYREVERQALAGALDQPDMEPVVIAEEGGTRIATPYFSILLPDDVYSNLLTYRYSPGINSWDMADESGYYKGHQLTLKFDHGSSEPEPVYVYVTSDDWGGVQGSLACNLAGKLASDDGFQVNVAIPADNTSPDYEDRLEELARYTSMVSVDIVAVENESGTWEAQSMK